MTEPAEEAALRAVLGLPATFPMRSRRTGEGAQFAVEIPIEGSPPLRIALSDRGDTPPLEQVGGLRLTSEERLGDGARGELLDRLRRRFVRAAGSRPEAVAALRRPSGSRLALLQQQFVADGWDLWHGGEGEARYRIGLLRLGFRCNQDCHFCWQGRRWPDADAGGHAARIDRLAASGLRRLSITGGEPTAFKELPEVIAHAHQRGLEVSLQTNAIALSSRRYLDRLTEAGLAEVFVSLHSADEEASDAMTRAPGTWRRTVAGIERCLEAGLVVRVNCVVLRSNVAGLVDHARFVVDRFVTPFDPGALGVNYSHPNQAFDAAAFQAESVPLDEVAGPLSGAARLLLDAGLRVEVLGSCGFPPCVVQDVPELLRSLRLGDFPEMDQRSRLFGEACDGCAVRAGCFGLRREYRDVHGERGLRPFVEAPAAWGGR